MQEASVIGYKLIPLCYMNCIMASGEGEHKLSEAFKVSPPTHQPTNVCYGRSILWLLTSWRVNFVRHLVLYYYCSTHWCYCWMAIVTFSTIVLLMHAWYWLPFYLQFDGVMWILFMVPFLFDFIIMMIFRWFYFLDLLFMQMLWEVKLQRL